MNAKGRVFKYGNNVDTDVIIPARYLNSSEPEYLAAHCMEDIDAGFLKNVKPGDIIVAEDNFGCGSSREHAPIAIKACGISCVIANSYARIFFRNAINIGMPILECPEAVAGISAGDTVEVNFDTGVIRNVTSGKTFQAQPFPPFLQRIILPTISLSFIYVALIARMTRAAMLDVLGEDYVRTARAKGIGEWGVLLRHALRNAAVPVITVIGSGFALLISGVVVTESVFNLPGIGRLTVDSVLSRDYPVIQGMILLTSLVYVLVNLLIDVAYTLLDPRIRY